MGKSLVTGYLFHMTKQITFPTQNPVHYAQCSLSLFTYRDREREEEEREEEEGEEEMRGSSRRRLILIMYSKVIIIGNTSQYSIQSEGQTNVNS